MFQSVGCAKKKQAAVSHNFTGSEVISLDAGLRMDGIPALNFWDMVFEVLLLTQPPSIPDRKG